MNKIVQAKNIPDDAVVAIVRDVVRDSKGVLATTWDVCERLPQYPAKVVCAKLGALVRRGLLKGEPYPRLVDRGDFEIVEIVEVKA